MNDASARTSAVAENLERERQLARLAILVGQAIGFVNEGMRSSTMTDAMLYCLQLYKEDRLAGAMESSPQCHEPPPQLSSEDVLRNLSLLVESMSMSSWLRKYFRKRGIRCVGEIYAYSNRHCADGSDSWATFKKLVAGFLSSHGLPRTPFDLTESGWKPPYDNPTFRDLLYRPAETVLKPVKQLPDELKNLYRDGRFVGDLFMCDNNEVVRQLLNPQFKLHAGMWFKELHLRHQPSI